MKRGLLIVNEFLNTQKFSEHTRWLLQAAEHFHMELEARTNAEVLAVFDSHGRESFQKCYGELPEFVLSWDKDIRLAKYFEHLGIPVFNSSKGIENCDDKSLTHLILDSAGIPMPKTVVAPMTYPNIGYTNDKFLNRVIQELEFPIVVKECFGSFGAQVYLCCDEQELKKKVQEIGAKPMLFQEFIHESAGKDVRLQVVGGKVIAAMHRYSVNGDFRANITNGGKMKPYEPSKEEEELAVKVCEKLELGFAGVDLLFTNDNKKIVCEVNSNAHFKNIYDCTGVNTAEAIIQYIGEQI